MNNANSEFKSLSVEMIENAPEIREWISQFSSDKQPVAKVLLSKLIFVTRDMFSTWLVNTMEDLSVKDMTAVYSVRKLNDTDDIFWDDEEVPVARPSTTLGSEDLVYSLISNIKRSNNNFLDHPTLKILKENKVRNYILIDDAIGSGNRVSTFINAMLKNKTFLSWWSYGYVKIQVISFARTNSAEKNIIYSVKGSNHPIRKNPKASKISFISEYVYNETCLNNRWGDDYRDLLQLCEGETKVKKKRRLGYGNVFSNLIFYHSVPNNIPGILWCTNNRWSGLMPSRAIPLWLFNLLESVQTSRARGIQPLSPELYEILKLSKIGIRRISSLSMRLNLDIKYTKKLLQHAENIGLMTDKSRLTATGREKIIEYESVVRLASWDKTMYIPSSWCVD